MISFRLIAAVAAPMFLLSPAFAEDMPTLMTSPTPDSGSTIKWNTPGSSGAPSAQPTAPDTPPSKPASSALPPGSTIHFSDDPPVPAAMTAGPTTGTVSPIPPGTPFPPGSTIHWADDPNASATMAPPSIGAPPPSGAVAAPEIRWRSAVQGDTVEIMIVDPAAFYRVDRIDLVAPDGRELPAQELTRIAPSNDIPIRERGTFGIGGWGGSSSGVNMGIGMGFPIGGRPSPPPDPDRNFARTIAHIILNDPVGYRRTASAWSVKVRLLDPSGVSSTARFAAPLPPRS